MKMMMSKGGCVNGSLDTTLYASPVPMIGLYIVVATLVCFFCITFDLVHGFIRKRPFVPCRLFPLNSFTMTVLAVATKIPVDLTTSMPRSEDQLTKLTGTALLCTSLGFYMPSLGTMSTSERYGNLAALSVIVITVVVNVCIQMGTGVIFAFTVEHIIIMVCILLLLLLMWSSALAFRSQKESTVPYYRSKISEGINHAKDVQSLRELLVKLHILNYTGNPQTLICETSHHHAFGLLCTISLAVVLQAMLRSFALKNMRLCSGVSDYRWSIPMVIVAQFLTIAVGTFSIIYRWFSFVSHTKGKDVFAHGFYYDPKRELEYLKLKTLSLGFLSKNLFVVFLVAKSFTMDVLMRTQILLYTCSSILGIPIYSVKKFLEYIIPFDNIFRQHIEDIDEKSTSVSKIQAFVLSSVHDDDSFDPWIRKMAMKDMMRCRNTYKRDCSTHLIKLISKCPVASKSECALFIRKLEARGGDFVNRFKKEVFFRNLEEYKYEYEYRVSCVSVLILSGMLVELMPSSRQESLMHNLEALDESFEIICYVDQKTDTPIAGDETRWTLIEDVWTQWKNPNHWLRSKIMSHVFKSCSLKKFEESELELHHALGVIEDAHQALKKYCTDFLLEYEAGHHLATKHMAVVAVETSIMCKFICEQNYGSVKDLFDFLEMCLVKMLYFFLSGLPLAIVKEIHGDDPTEIGEGRVRKAFKFLHGLELLGDTKIEWSWPAKFVPKESQANDDLSLLQYQHNQISSSTTAAVATGYGLEVEAKFTNFINGKVGITDASLADAADACVVDDDTIEEIGSDEMV